MADIYQRPRSAVYQARIRVNDVVQRVSTGHRDPVAAQQAADKLEQELNDQAPKKGDIPIIAATDRFITDHPKGLRPRTIKDYKRHLVNVVEYLGDFPMLGLTEKRIREYMTWREAQPRKEMHNSLRGHVTLRKDLAFLSAVYTAAREWEDCEINHNPVKGVSRKRLATARSHVVRFTPADLERLLAACRLDWHKRFIILAAFTGMRHGEVLGLHWDEINLEEKFIFLGGHRTKNRCSREIPIIQPVLDTLLSTPEHTRWGFVFKGRDGRSRATDMGKRWNDIRLRADMPHVRIHDLRHAYASWLKQRGVAETTIMDLMGHKTRSMVQRYSHESTESRQRAAAVLETHF